MATKAKRKAKPRTPTSPRARPVQAPNRREPTTSARRGWLALGAATALVVATVVAAILVSQRGGGSSNGSSSASTSAAGALPQNTDYHSLVVSGRGSTLLLGIHGGLYRSRDGGRSWAVAGLEGTDAMNLVPAGKTLFLGGHDAFARSSDGGKTWQDIQPQGLPNLDIHGLAADPRNPRTLYAVAAGSGLYRSRDGGRSFSLLSPQGGMAMALAVTADGWILAADMEEGLVSSRDGQSWQQLVPGRVMGIAVNPRQPRRVLATGSSIMLSTDGGRSFLVVMPLAKGLGAVAWAPANQQRAYAVGYDGVLYRSDDGGENWAAVGQ